MNQPPKAKKESVFSDTWQVEAALRLYFPEREYAFLPQVRNCTGYGRTVRTADALVVSLWPSRGISLSGIEIKVSRADWLAELKSPEKADEIAKFCDFWWVAVGSADIVRQGELPATWGLLVPNGEKLKAKISPKALTPEPPTIKFLAAVLRKAGEVNAAPLAIKTEKSKSYEEGYKQGKENAAADCERHNREYNELLAAVEEFSQKSGVRIDKWNTVSIAEAVRDVTRGANSIRNQIDHEIYRLEQILKVARKRIEAPVDYEISEYII